MRSVGIYRNENSNLGFFVLVSLIYNWVYLMGLEFFLF